MFDCETREIDGQFVFATCAITGAEGIFSGTQPDSLRQWQSEHALAHDRKATADLRRISAQNARRIYRTTEPGDPARRGIGPYL